MNKQLIHTASSILCGLALLSTLPARAQGGSGEIVTLWGPSNVSVTNATGDSHDVYDAVNGLFYNMLCAMDSQNHAVIGQRQGQKLQKLVDIPPTQMKNYGQNQIYLWGQVQYGPLKGAQMAAIFKQVSSKQIDAKLRFKTPYPKQVDVTVAYQMTLIYNKHDQKKPDEKKPDDKYGKKGGSSTPPGGDTNPPPGGDIPGGNGGGSGTPGDTGTPGGSDILGGDGGGTNNGGGTGGGTPGETPPIGGGEGSGDTLPLPLP